MRPARRSSVLLFACALGLSACADGEPASTPTPTAATSDPSPTAPPTQPPVDEPTQDPTGQPLLVEVREGRVVGGAPTIEAVIGESVTFRVLADVADEVHVHGVDHHVDVTPGVEATVEFVAEIPGQFEIELEQAGVRLAELVVR